MSFSKKAKAAGNVTTPGSAGVSAFMKSWSWMLSPLRQKALDLVEQGKSTLEEVLRVTRSEVLDVGDPTGAGTEA
jgi:hypothetical protein